MSTHIHHFFNNTGGINLQSNVSSLADDEAEDIVNLHATRGGGWSSRNVGFTTITFLPLSTTGVNGMYQFVEETGTEHTIVAAGANIYEFNIGAGTGTILGSGFTTDNRVNFITFLNRLILCNGQQSPKKWDGSGILVDLPGWPPTIAGFSPGYPSLSAVFANRLVFSGDASNPSVLYISALENPENFTPTTGPASAGAIQVSPGDGDVIKGIISLYLPVDNEEVLVIFKEHSIYLLTGHDADTFALQKVTGSIGAVSHQSIVLLGNDLIFLSAEGVSTLSTATLQGNLAAGSISQKISPQISSLNAYVLGSSFAVHMPSRQEIWWFVAEGSNTENQTVLVYNYQQGKAVWSKRSGIVASAGLVVNRQLYTGSYVGTVQQQLIGNTYNGAAIPWSYRTPFYTFAQPRLRKRIREVEMYMTQLASTTFTVGMSWDYERSTIKKQSRTVSVKLDAKSTLYGVAIYGQDYYDRASISRQRITPDGSGRSFQLEFTGSLSGQPVEIQGWSIITIEGGL